MDNKLVQGVTLATALGAGLVAGVLFAFSAFVLPALHRLPARNGLAAMQSINKLAVGPALMLALFGTALLGAGLGVYALVHRGQAAAPYLVAGALVYLVGVIGLTAGYHVPLNDHLATVAPTSSNAAAKWNDYVTSWTRWNHVRAAAGFASSALFVIALRVL